MSNARLIVFSGPPCSGKSTLAAEISRRYGLPHLSMDATRRRILPDAAHTRADRQAAYRAMHMCAELLLDAGAGAILDAPYGHTEDREDLESALGGRSALWIECRVSAETAVQRFVERGPDSVRLDLTEELVRRLVTEYPYTGAGLQIDTGKHSPQACLALVCLAIDRFPKPE